MAYSLKRNKSTSYGRPGCKDAVWEYGIIIKDKNPELIRKDSFGNIINYEEHGKTTNFGWDIDHTIAKAKGGSDTIENLRPVHFSKNRSMGARMAGKDMIAWFKAIEQYRGIVIDKRLPFKFIIGKTVLVKQHPASNEQPAIIKDINIKQKIIKVRFLTRDYDEDIVLYKPLFRDI